jgi:hypothetical protein
MPKPQRDRSLTMHANDSEEERHERNEHFRPQARGNILPVP